MRACRLAARMALGPMSTPRRPAPRSIGTPMTRTVLRSTGTARPRPRKSERRGTGRFLNVFQPPVCGCGVEHLLSALRAVGLFESDQVEQRPWGIWVDWYRTPEAALKCMVVEAGARMSLQRHKQR